ncbi:hypothetical protein A2U01_0057034, partial [Trifolium medium]|nr:hypothetical protein [Trifolium medium]
MKEKTITPDAAQDVEASEDQTNPNVAQDVGASKDLSNPNAATITESFGSSSEFDASTEEEVQKNGGTPEVVVDSEPEKSKEKEVSVDDDVTESEKIATEGHTMINLDDLETDEDPQSKPVQKGVGRRLRSRT